jgi:hypothetical protein
MALMVSPGASNRPPMLHTPKRFFTASP